MPAPAAYPLDVWTPPGATVARTDQRYRDDAGRPLSGFIRRDYAATSAVTVIVAGRPCGLYRFPRYSAPPTHRMIRWRNLAMVGGWAMCDERGGSYLAADAPMRVVVAGLKPTGTVRSDPGADARAGEGFEIGGGLIAWRVPLGELFDLQAIAAYYAAVVPEFAGAIGTALAGAQRQTPARALQCYDWANSAGAGELALTVLCLGYPLESTAALLV